MSSRNMNDDTVWARACAADELEEGSPLECEQFGRALCLYRVEGQVYATDNVCTHGNGNLSDGDIEGFDIECPYHGGRFDIRTGTPTLLPCTVPITVYPAREADGAVWVCEPTESTDARE